MSVSGAILRAAGRPSGSACLAALVAAEGHRCYAEPGPDPFAIARVIAIRLTFQPGQGGSTLDQQLAGDALHAPLAGLITRAPGAASWGWMWAAERPALRTGATRRGPRPPRSIVPGQHVHARQADTGRGHLRASGSPRAG